MQAPELARWPLLLLLSVGLCAGEQHFWDKSDPTSWTPQQITQLETVSPWAKKVTAELLSNSSNMATSMPRTGGGGGGRGGGRYSSRGSGSDTPVQMPKLQGLVQWVSAAPLRAVLKPKLPASFQGRYVICVSGLPVAQDMTQAVEDTTLQLKRGDTIHPEAAYQDPADTSAIYFAFLPSMIDGQDGKTLVFDMAISPYGIKAKFNLAEMKYHGEPAL